MSMSEHPLTALMRQSVINFNALKVPPCVRFLALPRYSEATDGTTLVKYNGANFLIFVPAAIDTIVPTSSNTLIADMGSKHVWMVAV